MGLSDILLMFMRNEGVKCFDVATRDGAVQRRQRMRVGPSYGSHYCIVHELADTSDGHWVMQCGEKVNI